MYIDMRSSALLRAQADFADAAHAAVRLANARQRLLAALERTGSVRKAGPVALSVGAEGLALDERHAVNGVGG